MLFAARLARSFQETDYLKLISFLFFIAANYFATWLFFRKFHKAVGTSAKLFAIEGLLIVICGIGFYLVASSGGSTEVLSVNSLLLMMVVFALGIQNAVPKLDGSKAPATTVMTGNVTQFATDLTRFMLKLRSEPGPSGKPEALFTTVPVIVAFTVGCIGGAFLTVRFGLVSILLPGTLLLLSPACRQKIV